MHSHCKKCLIPSVFPFLGNSGAKQWTQPCKVGIVWEDSPLTTSDQFYIPSMRPRRDQLNTTQMPGQQSFGGLVSKGYVVSDICTWPLKWARELQLVEDASWLWTWEQNIVEFRVLFVCFWRDQKSVHNFSQERFLIDQKKASFFLIWLLTTMSASQKMTLNYLFFANNE